ncbi:MULTISPECIES: hypothetical protein [Ensifer]|jgi:hypothetical protein|uniref:hypothetical protein n=1 Tax=Ensifer TaxID=106591 RepID=UPI0007161FA0|nr:MULTISPECIES: hypothetical protein [Ensifer]KQX56009.1 hypothetical protein ASD49_24925 [Ensifer sp. Root1298]KQX91842.1 hypothetical protein ASD41_23615 [Ensifer sp. Root1312]KRC26834.1 hypothetical protein ASE29_21295 [Ensifer sp. Root74]KRD71972.1 hypothetical protein ASE71_22605 [Ensifer sp. Root954]
MPKKSAQNETDDLLETLVFTSEVIANSDADSRRRISEAYVKAQRLAATIPLEEGSPRPRIVACLEIFNAHKEAGRVEAAGWMLTAIQHRVAEKNLPEWEKLQIVVDKVRHLLGPRYDAH